MNINTEFDRIKDIKIRDLIEGTQSVLVKNENPEKSSSNFRDISEIVNIIKEYDKEETGFLLRGNSVVEDNGIYKNLRYELVLEVYLSEKNLEILHKHLPMISFIFTKAETKEQYIEDLTLAIGLLITSRPKGNIKIKVELENLGVGT